MDVAKAPRILRTREAPLNR